jgi:type I restriction enzyme M protein
VYLRSLATSRTSRWLRIPLEARESPGSARQPCGATWSQEPPKPDGLARITLILSLDIFWLRDESLEDSASLPEPHELAEEIAEDLRSALEQIESVLGDLRERARPTAG